MVDGYGVRMYDTGADVRSYIYYDQGNTAYYVNADGTSNLNGLSLAGSLSGGSISGGTITASTKFNGPYMEDSNNTAYFINPAGPSNVSTLEINGNSQMLGGAILRFGPNLSTHNLEIQDTGSYNRIDTENQDLFIRGVGRSVHLSASYSGTPTIVVKASVNGLAYLYASGSEKLRTSSSGITVTGTVAATSYTGDGSNLTGISAGATGGGSDEIFWENGQNVTTNYTITNGQNAMSAGPITINSGVTVTIGAGEAWTIV